DAAFDGVAGLGDMALAPGQITSRGDFDLRLDEIDADDPLGHRMLDLQTGIHFEKVEVLLLIEQKLQRSRADVADRAGALNGDPADAPARAIVHSGRRRFFENLLMAPLNRALAIVEMNDVAVIVGENLNFHVARPLDEFLDIKPGIAEG